MKKNPNVLVSDLVRYKPGYTATVDGLKFRIYKVEGLYYRVAKTKTLISFAVTAKLICVFVFAYIQKAGFLTARLTSHLTDSHQWQTYGSRVHLGSLHFVHSETENLCCFCF